MTNSNLPEKVQNFVIFQTETGKINIEVFFHNETLWLTQKKIAELFEKDRSVITKHLKNIFNEGELDEKEVLYYNFRAIAAVSYRVNFDRADELGSGMRKMMLYGKKYGDADPELTEGDIFRMVIGVPEFGANPAEIPQIVSATQPSGQRTRQVTRQVLNLLKIALGERSRKELMEAMGLTARDNFEKLYLRPALDAELIEMTIPDKLKCAPLFWSRPLFCRQSWTKDQ